MTAFDYKNRILLYDDTGSSHITVAVYENWVSDKAKGKDKDKIADLIVNRLLRRYIKPFEFDDAEYKNAYKNGFVMLASYCLLIETIEGFYRGWEKNKSEMAFLKFFTRDSNFKEFATGDLPTMFYKNIRNGILHQGETDGGWLITRREGDPLLGRDPYCVNATKFGELLKRSLDDYRMLLKNSNWDDQIWVNARCRMKVAISNCKSLS